MEHSIGPCEDSCLLSNILPEELCTLDIFEKIINEVEWKEQRNKGGIVPRLISYQGDFDVNGNIPIYRVPSDEIQSTAPFTPIITLIKQYVEEIIQQKCNHCLIQLYRSSRDYISEHSDKTLDISRGLVIVNLSLGATRQMKLYSKPDLSDKKITETFRLPHNSLFVLGWQTNINYLHAIKQDKREDKLKSPDEMLFGGRRISLTFRSIATFQRPDKYIFGQGAPYKTEVELNTALNLNLYHQTQEDPRKQSEDLLKAFSIENHSCLYDWDVLYGTGFDISQISLS